MTAISGLNDPGRQTVGPDEIPPPLLNALKNPYDKYKLPPSLPSSPYTESLETPLAPPPPPTLFPSESGEPGKRTSRRNLLIGGAAVLAAGAGIYWFSRRNPLSPLETIPVTFAYSTEKSAWLQAAVSAFQQASATYNKLSNKTISIQLSDLGSVDGQAQILSGQLKPVIWSPASNLEVNRLDYKWQQENGGKSIISYTEQFQPQSLVKSPLVLAAWQQRAQALLTYYHVQTLDWPTLYSAFQANSWASVGGQASWGPVKFGQTLPTQSNSGLLSITLLAYHYFGEERNLTIAQVNEQNYWDYLHVFESAVNEFGHSSGTYLKNDLLSAGPAQADVIATYENLVLTLQAQAQSDQQQPLLIYYPDVNIVSDHPFVVLQAHWVTDEQKQAALQFRNFLLDLPQQRVALSYGFRPGNSLVSLTDASISPNPFLQESSIFPERRPNILQEQAQTPAGNVVDALITRWHQSYPTPYTTDG